jgi:hypothetical protein
MPRKKANPFISAETIHAYAVRRAAVDPAFAKARAAKRRRSAPSVAGAKLGAERAAQVCEKRAAMHARAGNCRHRGPGAPQSPELPGTRGPSGGDRRTRLHGRLP